MAETDAKKIRMKDFITSDVDISDKQGGYYTNSFCKVNEETGEAYTPDLDGACSAMGDLQKMNYYIDANTYGECHWFWANLFPEMTGVSFCFLASQSYGDYNMYLWDRSYKPNPASKEWNSVMAGGSKWDGFKTTGWQCTKKVTNPETLESADTTVVCNDNSIFYHMIEYGKAPTEAAQLALKRVKFDFAFNKDYSIKNIVGNDAGELLISAEANNECICLCKCNEGIIVCNWATFEYPDKEARTCLGSLSGIRTQFMDMINAMVEKEIISFKDANWF